MHIYLLLLAPTLAMSLVIALSNYLVQFVINDWLTWAAFSYPLCFLVTDLANRFLGAANARKVVWCGFMVGVVLSLVTSTERIALASGAAFLVAQMLDVQVFDRLRHSDYWWRAPLVSSALGSLFDTLLFFSLAFAFTGVPWVTLALGDFAAKVVMFIVLLSPYRILCGLCMQLGAQKV